LLCHYFFSKGRKSLFLHRAQGTKRKRTTNKQTKLSTVTKLGEVVEEKEEQLKKIRKT